MVTFASTSDVLGKSMKDLAIYGAGGQGRELAAMIININKAEPTWNLVGFFDDGKQKGEEVSHYGKVLGGSAEVNAWTQPLCVIISLGSPMVRKIIRNKINNPLISFPNLIHPDFFVRDPETFKIGEGNVIMSECVATVNVTIGDFNLFAGSNVLTHDDVVGNYNVFMPDTRMSGEVVIGDCNLFGVGSIVIQQLTIGNEIRLGAGSVMMTKPTDGHTYLGVPARNFASHKHPSDQPHD